MPALYYRHGRTVLKFVSTVSDLLEKLLGYFWPFPGRPLKHDLSTWTVTEKWHEHISVTEAEVDVFETWFCDLFDELLRPGH